MGLSEKIANAESSDWLCKDMTDEEVIKIISEAKEEARKRIKLVDTLDKIRAEIKELADKQFQIAMGVSDLNERYAHIQMENAYRHSLNIIDKYKEESEG